MELYRGHYPNLVDPARRILLIRVIRVIRDLDNTIPFHPSILPSFHSRTLSTRHSPLTTIL